MKKLHDLVRNTLPGTKFAASHALVSQRSTITLSTNRKLKLARLIRRTSRYENGFPVVRRCDRVQSNASNPFSMTSEVHSQGG